MPTADVRVLLGSDSDYEVVQEATKVLREFRVSFDVKVLSAHRTPRDLVAYIEQAERDGAKVFIGAAGGAAHLAGIIAAHTTRPVLAIPIPTVLNGLDSLLSMAQMPGGVPVAAFAIGKAGARNAALFAVQVLALTDERLAREMGDYRRKLGEQVSRSDAALREKLRGESQ